MLNGGFSSSLLELNFWPIKPPCRSSHVPRPASRPWGAISANAAIPNLSPTMGAARVGVPSSAVEATALEEGNATAQNLSNLFLLVLREAAPQISDPPQVPGKADRPPAGNLQWPKPLHPGTPLSPETSERPNISVSDMDGGAAAASNVVSEGALLPLAPPGDNSSRICMESFQPSERPSPPILMNSKLCKIKHPHAESSFSADSLPHDNIVETDGEKSVPLTLTGSMSSINSSRVDENVIRFKLTADPDPEAAGGQSAVAEQGAVSSAAGMGSSSHRWEVITLNHLLGKTAHGRVMSGTWRGISYAVKVRIGCLSGMGPMHRSRCARIL